jgi:hypothetical protein
MDGARRRLASTFLWLVAFPCSYVLWLLTGNKHGFDAQLFDWDIRPAPKWQVDTLLIGGLMTIANSILWGCLLTWLIRRRLRDEDLPNTMQKPSNAYAALIGCFALCHFVAVFAVMHLKYWFPEVSDTAIKVGLWILALPLMVLLWLWQWLFPHHFALSPIAGSLFANSLLWAYALTWLARWLWRATCGKPLG